MTAMPEADPTLIARWAAAWAISRGAAAPVPRDGGLYIHVGTPEQVGRYIFAALDSDTIALLAAKIDQPLLYLKVCAPADAVRPLLPPGWEIAPPGYMMTAPVTAMLARPAIPGGFALTVDRQGNVIFATIADSAGNEAARGRIVTMDGLVVFDRIATAEPHQRRGLGTAVMRALAAEADAIGIHDAMLCATPVGRALYTALGWSLHSDYTTASLSP
ncbi:GNAT family N-acetyltransferase [Sphingomonas bacterium]|uniref:GNAT family N-acetyltransferase n=1 Tax=Sphingomonas bacterium TaxID=1895847 RepID=UPI00261703FC|nr:GNAT family N-acetyltransferase [Sphingomonas bacterium]MDB5679658.1 family N-acetyltransferase [Sphingomonas bacterium]